LNRLGVEQMDWIVVAKCSECKKQETFEVTSDRPPYSIGEHIDSCPCGGKYIVEEILEVD
jgi:hypothetical protein